MQVVKNKLFVKLLLQRLKPPLTCLSREMICILNAYGATNLQKLTTTLKKKISRKIQIYYSLYSAPKMLRALKTLGGRQKTRRTREKIVEIVSLVVQDIKNSPQQLRPTLLRFYQITTKRGKNDNENLSQLTCYNYNKK